MEYDARGNVIEYIDGRKTKFVRKYTKTDLLSSEEVFTVKEDDNNYKSTPDASRSYAYDNLNRVTSVLLCLFKHFDRWSVLISVKERSHAEACLPSFCYCKNSHISLWMQKTFVLHVNSKTVKKQCDIALF